MSNFMKYIMIDGYLDEQPVLFPKSISHDVMASNLSHMGQVVSAGFVDMVDGELSAYGESTSLGIKAREIDTHIINKNVGA